LDSKKKIGEWAFGSKFIKINEKEFQENITPSFLRGFLNNLIVTKGKNGATLINLGDSEDFSIEEVHLVRDLSGAGDTFFAALVADYVKNNDIRKAIRFANKCASWVVTQKGVVVVDLCKINE
jgi:sugar/nucleoside kinase (ribokinase family)